VEQLHDINHNVKYDPAAVKYIIKIIFIGFRLAFSSLFISCRKQIMIERSLVLQFKSFYSKGQKVS